jgi:hypothetical protein
MTGGVASRLIVTDLVVWSPAPEAAKQLKVVPAVSVFTELCAHCALVIPETPPVSFHATVTLLVYQPLAPCVPVTTGVIDGRLASFLIVTVCVVFSPAPSVAVQLTVCPAVSALMVVGGHA